MHWNQQVILSLFYQASHEGRIYSPPKLQKSRYGFASCVCVAAFILLSMLLGKLGEHSKFKKQELFRLFYSLSNTHV